MLHLPVIYRHPYPSQDLFNLKKNIYIINNANIVLLLDYTCLSENTYVPRLY